MALTLAVIGSIMLDVTVEAPRLPRSGENLYVHGISASAGGKGANTTVTLARHGAHVHLIGNVGNDAWGEQVRGELQRTGVDVTLMGSASDEATGIVVMVAEDGGQVAYMADTGANRSLTAGQVRERLAPLLPELDGLLFNFEPPEETVQLAAQMAREARIPFFVDAGPERHYDATLWERAAIITPNGSEAQILTGHGVDGDARARTAAQALLAQGPQAVVIKLGAQGALWANAQGTGMTPAFPVEAVDAAGAGDAFSAGLMWATLSGQTLPEAVRWANACGALVASRAGTLPSMPFRAEVEALLGTYERR